MSLHLKNAGSFFKYPFHILYRYNNTISQLDKKIDAINGLRGLAILAVVYQHSLSLYVRSFMKYPIIIGNGWMGVNLFFILSGFVLYRPYFLQQRSFVSFNDVLKFYLHRFSRLYPLFAFVCVVSIIFNTHVNRYTIMCLVQTLSTFTLFSEKEFFPYLNGVYWSLAIEIWFSLLFPLLVYAINKTSLNKVATGVFCVSLLIRLLGCFCYHWAINVNLNPVKDSVPARLDDFILGFIICKWYYNHARIVALSTGLLVSGAVIFILGTCLLWDDVALYSGPVVIEAFTNNILQIGLLLLIVAALKAGNWVNLICRQKGLQLLGMMCFSIYSWHGLMVPLFFTTKGTPLMHGAIFLTYAIFTFIISAFTYRYIEFRAEADWRKLFLIGRSGN